MNTGLPTFLPFLFVFCMCTTCSLWTVGASGVRPGTPYSVTLVGLFGENSAIRLAFDSMNQTFPFLSTAIASGPAPARRHGELSDSPGRRIDPPHSVDSLLGDPEVPSRRIRHDLREAGIGGRNAVFGDHLAGPRIHHADLVGAGQT